MIDEMIADAELDEYVRWAAAGSFALLVRDGRMRREDAVRRLAGHLRRLIDRNDEKVAGFLVSTLRSLAPAEAREEIRLAYDLNMVDRFLVEAVEVERAIAGGEAQMREQMKRWPPSGIADTVAELESWAAFRRDKARGTYQPVREPFEIPEPLRQPLPAARVPAHPTPQLSSQRVGRNEPCPCGSGRKYKKCCGAPK